MGNAGTPWGLLPTREPHVRLLHPQGKKQKAGSAFDILSGARKALGKLWGEKHEAVKMQADKSVRGDDRMERSVRAGTRFEVLPGGTDFAAGHVGLDCKLPSPGPPYECCLRYALLPGTQGVDGHAAPVVASRGLFPMLASACPSMRERKKKQPGPCRPHPTSIPIHL